MIGTACRVHGLKGKFVTRCTLPNPWCQICGNKLSCACGQRGPREKSTDLRHYNQYNQPVTWYISIATICLINQSATQAPSAWGSKSSGRHQCATPIYPGDQPTGKPPPNQGWVLAPMWQHFLYDQARWNCTHVSVPIKCLSCQLNYLPSGALVTGKINIIAPYVPSLVCALIFANNLKYLTCKET